MNFFLNPFLQRDREEVVTPVSALTKRPYFLARPLSRSLMKVNLVALLLGLGLSQVDASSYAQQVTLKRQKASLESVLKDLEKQSGYTFFYKKADITPVKGVDVDMNNVPLNQALGTVLRQGNFTFEYFDKTIVIKKRTLPETRNISSNRNPENQMGVPVFQQQSVRGKVLDENGKPIKGASIREKANAKNAVISGEDGSFAMPITSLNELLVISYMGYGNKEIKASLNPNQMIVQLVKRDTEVEEVVVTGMMEKRKETFTGSSSNYTMEEIKAVGNTNLIQSLKTLDPSFILMENNLAGSNPNTLATIELRGTTSITTDALRDEFSEDPNQPLFILDGFPTSLRVITDLDINRILSVTLLKDAASTAMYGSRASNGVVVVETIRPKANEITVNYSTDANFDFPDLRSYNMMNSAEKLEFERLSGRYLNHPRLNSQENQMGLDSMYSARLEKVLQGVNSYWLSDPVRTAYSQRHSVMINGGEGALAYAVGGDYRYNRGIMKGSSRDTWGTRFNVSYRGSKLNLSNQLYINGYNSEESPYGSFSKWANTNPYFEKQDESVPYLDILVNPYRTSERIYVVNPFYSAYIGNFDRSSNYQITNNTMARYDISSKLRAEATLQVNKVSTVSNEFISPRDDSFRQKSFLESGSYTNKNIGSLAYTGNVSLNYSNVFAEKHIINGMLRGEMSSKTAESSGYKAVGFPSLSNGNPKFAYGYPVNARPQSSMVINRRTSIVSTLNYSFDRTYNVDLTYSLDGTTAFGVDNLYSSFYSFGGSWNLHRESFFKEVLPAFDQFRVRANYGITGNQNFTSYTSVSTYDYIIDFNPYGQGLELSSLGNKGLKWQNTYQTGGGVDLGIWNGRLRGVFDVYRRKTDPLVVAVALPPSTALSNYPMNAGTLTVDGAEATLTFFPIFRPTDRVMWSVRFTGATNKQIYSNFDNVLEGLNNNLRKSKSLKKYRDGGDASDIWAVPSLGIDPATGLEVFLKKDGTYSYQHDYADEIVVGNSRPQYQGVLSTGVTYKGFTFNLAMRYIYNQDVFNSALFDKVENISMSRLISSNQDKRALYDRWKNPGDISEFRRILLTDFNYNTGYVSSGTDVTPMSSRFVQKENRIAIESVNLGYELRDTPWITKYRLSNLKFSAYMNEIAYWSTVKRERGIDYPFARSVSFSVSANFK